MSKRDDERGANEGTRAHVTLLFSDLCDYTALNELNDPEESDSLRRRIENEVKRIIHAHRGVVTQCYGDGTLAVFGLVSPAEDDARHAVEAAIEVHEAVRTLHWDGVVPSGFALRMHSGVHAGLVFVRNGDTLHGRYELTGDAVNLAARLSSAAERDQILVSETTLRAMESFFTTEAARDLRLKGKQAAVRVSRVTGRSNVTTRFEARIRSGLTPLVGRGPELGCLDEVLGESREGRGRLVLVRGVLGIGKTRLLEEFRRRASQSGVNVLSGCCDGYTRTAPLDPFLQILRQFFGFQNEMTPSEAVAQLETMLTGWGMQEHCATFLRLLSLPSGEPARWSAGVTTLTTLRALAALAARASEAMPIALLLDDWQWSDEMSRVVLRFLCRHFKRQRMCVLVSMRDDDGFSPGLRAHMTLKLAPLSERECKVIVAELRAHDLDVRLTNALHERSGGNPLFLEELCHSLPAEVMAGDQALERSAIPTTIHGLIQARISRLPLEALRALQVASVIGLEFTASMLAEIEAGPPDRALSVLVADGLIYAVGDGDTFRFKHGIARDVVYETVRIAERRTLHQRIASALEAAVAEGDLVDHSEALAFHHRGSGQHEAAAKFAALAGDKAAASSFLGPARAHYAAALASLDALPMTPELKRRWLAISARWSAQSAWAPQKTDLQTLARAVTYATELGDTAAQAHNSHMLGWFHYLLGDYGRSIAHYSHARELAEQTRNDKLVNHIVSILGQAHCASGDYPLALKCLNEGLALKRTRASQPLASAAGSEVGGRRATHYAHTLSCRAMLRADLGEFEAAFEDISEAADIVRGSGHAMEPSIYHHQSIIQLYRAAWSDCAKSAAIASKLAERAGSAYVYASGIGFESYARFMQKPSLAALVRLRRAVDWLEANDLRLYISLMYAALAEVGLAAGDMLLAREYARRALQRAAEGEPHGRISAHRTLASIARKLPDSRKLVEHHVGLALDCAYLLESKREIAITSLTAAQLSVSAGVLSQPLSLQRTLHELERMGLTYYSAQVRELQVVSHATL